VSDNRLTFRYEARKIEILKQIAFLERKKASQIIREALDERLNFALEELVEDEDIKRSQAATP